MGTSPWGLGQGVKSRVPVIRRWFPTRVGGAARVGIVCVALGSLNAASSLTRSRKLPTSKSQPVFQTLSLENQFSRLPGAWAEEQREARRFPRGDLRSPGVLALYRMFALGSVLRFKNYLGEL